MPRIHAELQVAGRCCEILRAAHGFSQPTDHLHRPNSTVHVDRIRVWLAGPGMADPLWPSWALDSYRRLSGRLVFYDDQGRTSRHLAFHDAYCISYQVHFDARGTRAGWPALVLALHLSAAAVELDGQLTEAHSVLPWPADDATRQRALTKAPDPLPSPGLRAGPLPVLTDFMRFDKKKASFAERPQSKKSGYLGSPRLTKPQLAALATLAAEKYKAPIRVVKAEEMAFITGNPNARAMFQTKIDGQTKQRVAGIYVQKGATYYEVIHELMHAKQYHQLGFDDYWKKQTTLQREEFVYQELMQNTQLSVAEIQHATDYLHFVRHGFWSNKA